MASIIPGYEYDIFISYRQKDNKYDGWVTEFVDNLKRELEATFKEEVSVYFDINPHDGLLETHDVDASLKEKLKCLIFIPIISHTYCDSKSFAWQYEFVAFNKSAIEGQVGRDIRLASGNVASRILPIKIHDLDPENKLLLEKELGGALRCIEFIYKSSGVNRPLRASEDHPRDNLNKIYYRDQINKVANAVKEIITALKKYNQQDGKAPKEAIKAKPGKLKKLKSKYLLYIGAATIIIFGFTHFNNIINIINQKNKFVRDESVITIESVNKTRDSLKILDPKIIEYLLKYNISNKSNLTLLNNIQFNKIYPPDKKEINLPQKNIICKIINSDFGYEIEFKIIDNNNGSEDKGKVIFHDPSELLNRDLDKITLTLGTKVPKKNLLTNDWDAFWNFYYGEINWNILNNTEAKKYFRKSIAIDPLFLLPRLRLAKISHFEGNNKAAIDYLNTVKESINNLTIQDSLRTVGLWNTLNHKTRDAINNYKLLISYLPAQKEPYFELAEAYFYLMDMNNAISNYRKALKFDPEFTLALNHLGYSFSHSGQHDSALLYFKKYVRLEPTANAYDSYGDGFFSCGKLDSAKWAKLKGLEVDSNREYLYLGLACINIREGKLKEAENHTNKYLSYETDPELISRGLTDKAFIYLINHEFRKSLDTCMKAKSIFDSKDIVTRNNVLHWILSRICIETNNSVLLQSEMIDMKNIIATYKIDEFNYNMIYKFYNDIKINLLVKQGKIVEAKEILSIFDNEIYNKIKDWHYPFLDVAFFNTEFGRLFLETNHLDLAKERFLKALKYNPNYTLAHYYLSLCLKKMNLPDEAEKHLEEFNKMISKADKDYINILLSEKI
jgi:tetratricopeptide (TPR) repeat protein